MAPAEGPPSPPVVLTVSRLASSASAARPVHRSSQPLTLATGPANRAPTADAGFDLEGTETITMTLDGTGSSDPDGDPITASLFGAPLHGTITLNADGSFTYTPNEGYVGIDSFIYWVNDGEVNSALAAVTIHVTEPSDPGETPLPDDDDDCLDDELVDSLVSGDSDPSAIDDLLSDGGWMS